MVVTRVTQVVAMGEVVLHSIHPSIPSGSETLKTVLQASLAGPQASLVGPQDPLAGPQTPLT